MQLEPDETGRTRIARSPAGDVTHPVDMVVLAMGFVGPETAALESQLGLALDARGQRPGR